MRYPDPINGNPVQYYEARDPVTDAVLLHEENEYKTETRLYGRIGLVRTTRGTGADAVTKTYSRDSYDKLIDVSDSSGVWSHYSYNYALPDKPVSMVESGFLNYTFDDFQTDPNLCRRVEYYYDSVDTANDDGTARPNTARTETEYLLGQFVSQTMRVVHTNAAGIVDWLKEYRMAAQNGDLSDPTNLVTTTTYITTGAFVGRVQTINNPDGTRQVYSYSDSSGQRTTTVLSGSPDTGNALNVLDGTRTVTVQNQNGAIVSSTIQDKASSITLSSETYSNPDEFGRFRRVTHLDGTYEDTQYACCGLDLTIDRDGVVTQYEYDATGRQVASTRLNIKTTNILNSASQVLATKRIGSDGSVITLSQSAYNDAGEVARETNALNGVTTYATTADAQGYLTIKTTVYPDGGTRIENYFQDGQLAKVTGTAVQPVRYDYGVESDAASPDYLRPYSKEIKLDGSGTDTSEWSKSYTDVFGRSYKTVYAAASAPYPFTQSFYNRKGQLVKSVDPDSVTTLYQYKATGETEFTATDMNTADTTQDGNGNFPLDLNVDRVTRATNDVYYNATYAVNVRRSQTYVYPTNSSSTPLLVSKQESSTDGLRGWQTVYRDISTPVVSASRTLYTNNDGATIPGYRTTTVTNLDTSKTVSVYYQGRLLSVARKSAANAQIAKTTYAYDAHGRQLTTTDARNGATTFAYNNADQMTSVTTPAPGNGQGPQTTITAYDTALRAWKVTQPDGTSVTNEFLLTGLLKRTYGTRTYPVGYSYDPQGRMKTMTNWSGFPSTGTRVTTWNYNAYRGFLSSKTYDGGSAGPSYTYTPAGRLLTRVWARGTNTTYAYNKAGDLSSVDYSDATSDVAYGYDRRGRQTVVTNGTAICTLTYNDASQLLMETNSGGTLNGLALTNAYDALLRRSAMALKTQPSTLVQFGYDTASRLASVTNGLNVATYTYLANSPLVSQIVFKTNNTTRMTTTKQYDLLNRLQQIASAPGASGVSPVSFSYTYNSANQRTGATQTDSSYWVYQYDSLGQVTSGKKYFSDGTPVPGQQFEYGFDDIGNRTSTKAGGNADGSALRSASYSANTLNQYTSRTVTNAFDVLGASHATNSVTVNGSAADYRRGEYFQELVSVVNSATSVWQTVSVTNSGGGSTTGSVFVAKTPELFYYDKDGNLTNDGRWLYTWDAENRLVNMTSTNTPPPGSKLKLDFVYDWQGRRIQKLVSTNNGSIYVAQYTNRFVYDGWNLLAILAPNASVLSSFVWGLDLSGSLQGAGV